MSIHADEVSSFFEKTLQICVEWLGLQTAATLILRILYLQHGAFLSTKEISDKTGLSLTSVSLTCTQLEALGVLRRETEYHKRKGRPRKLICIEGGIYELLKLGIKMHLDRVERIHDAIKHLKPVMGNESKIVNLDNLAQALGQFLGDYQSM